MLFELEDGWSVVIFFFVQGDVCISVCGLLRVFGDVYRGQVRGYRWYSRQSLVFAPVVGIRASRWFSRQSLVFAPVVGFRASRWYSCQSLVVAPVVGMCIIRWFSRKWLAVYVILLMLPTN